MLNAFLHVLRTGFQWTDIPPWKTVYSQFLRWRDKNLFQKLNNHLSRRLRVLRRKNADLSVGIVNSQSVKPKKKRALWI
jgi:transposase